MSTFWRNWLWGWLVAVALFGVVLAGAATEVTSGPIRLFFAIISHAGTTLELDAQMRFALAVMGCVTIGWSVTTVGAVRAAQELGERGRPIWRLITAGVSIWFVIDSTLSIVTGFELNAVSNVLFMAAFLLPLVCSGVLTSPPAGRPSAA